MSAICFSLKGRLLGVKCGVIAFLSLKIVGFCSTLSKIFLCELETCSDVKPIEKPPTKAQPKGNRTKMFKKNFPKRKKSMRGKSREKILSDAFCMEKKRFFQIFF